MKARRLFFASMLGALLIPSTPHAQYPYGKNKVVYQSRDWKMLKTEHVDLYHYAGDSSLIRYVAPLVESTFEEYTELFDVKFDRRLPFVLYATHYDFQQTNILPYLISEYTGGFTDLMKGRIAVPFTGSYSMLRHVVRHEMVHAFMLEKLKHVAKEHGKPGFAPPPLWFVEGMAEYFATAPQNRRGNMFVRDAIVNGKLYDLENIWRIQGSFMMYKQGEAVLGYIAANFGDEAIIKILENWWTADRFPLVLENTIGMNLRELDEGFENYAKRKYFPTLLRYRFASEMGHRVSPKKGFHTRSTVDFDDKGEPVVYSLCARDNVMNICEMRKDDDGHFHHRLLVKGGRSPGLESLPAIRSKLEVHGDTLVFVSKSGGRDLIYFWNVRKREKMAAFSFDGLSMIASPTLSGDRRKMVFSAIDTTGAMDLYRCFIDDHRLERLTHDGFSEEDPDYHPSREEILFTSDRGAGVRRERSHIYRMDLTTLEVTPIEGGEHMDASADWAPDGEGFMFVSDREGTENIYYDEGNVVVRQTSAVGGVMSPAVLPDGSGIVATVYEPGPGTIYQFPVRNGAGRTMALSPPDSTVAPWKEVNYDEDRFVTQDYKTHFQVDFVGVGVSVDPEFGELGNGGAIFLTDVLGNHQISAFFGSTTEDFDQFLERLNVGGTWVNLSHRVGYSISLFRLNSVNSYDFVTAQREKRLGGALGLSFALNKFDRIDTQVVMRQVERSTDVYYTEEESDKTFTSSLFTTYVRDRALWTIGGPATGYRFYLTGGQTVDFLDRGLTSSMVFFDARKYFKLTDRIIFALRFQSRNKFGGDADRVFYLGGAWSLRGYDFREFRGQSTQLFNSELRFPAIDGFKLALPFGVIELPMFRGSAFFDVGQAHRNRQATFLNTGWLGSMGLGIELNLGYAPVVRVNFTRTTDFDTIDSGTGVELFIGYNY